MQVSLYDFLKHGKFGSLRLGSPRGAVLEEICHPHYWAEKSVGVDVLQALRYDYPGLAIFFCDDEVICITVTVVPQNVETPMTWMDASFPCKTTLDEARILLAEHGISYLEGVSLDGVPTASIKTEGGVLLCTWREIEVRSLPDGSEEEFQSPVLTVDTLVLQRN